jgi:hypothetical protein
VGCSWLSVSDLDVRLVPVGAAPRPLFLAGSRSCAPGMSAILGGQTRLLARDGQYPRGAGSGPWDYLLPPWSRRRDRVVRQPPGSLRFARSRRGGAPTVFGTATWSRGLEVRGVQEHSRARVALQLAAWGGDGRRRGLPDRGHRPLPQRGCLITAGGRGVWQPPGSLRFARSRRGGAPTVFGAAAWGPGLEVQGVRSVPLLGGRWNWQPGGTASAALGFLIAAAGRSHSGVA